MVTSRCESSPAFQGLTLSPFQGDTDGLVEPKLMNRWQTLWCIDLCLAWVQDGMWAPLVSEQSQEMGIESVPEMLEHFQTLAWPSAWEDIVEFRHHKASSLNTTFLNFMNFLPNQWPRLKLQVVRFVGIYDVIIRNINPSPRLKVSSL